MDFNIVDFNIVDFVNSTNQLCINENEKKNDLRKMKKKKKSAELGRFFAAEIGDFRIKGNLDK